MPSLVKTLRRCHSSVWWLRNSLAPIWALVRPAPASSAMCASCAVSVSLARPARVLAPALTAEPLAVHQVGPGELHPDAGAAESFEGLLVAGFRRTAGFQQ